MSSKLPLAAKMYVQTLHYHVFLHPIRSAKLIMGISESLLKNLSVVKNSVWLSDVETYPVLIDAYGH